jgi:hypothetical protein
VPSRRNAPGKMTTVVGNINRGQITLTNRLH